LTGIARLRLAELTSGAVVLGLGLGVLLSDRLAGLGPAVLAAGIAVHAWGMYDKHRLERRQDVADPWWATALFLVCWLALAVTLAWAAFRP
jgi:hypothetical protein